MPMNRTEDKGDHTKKDGQGISVSAPTITLPKGGGAIRGIGEKFSANPVTGTGSMSVPITISPGRSGFGPQLSLSYDSGAGNGPFGLGWSLRLPQITRKTDKGLPRYDDANDSDVFILSGAEDLVPVFKQDAHGNWVRNAEGQFVIHEEDRDVDGISYRVRRYRPRIEGLFARIERWTRTSDGDAHWRSISRDNILTIYGKDQNACIASPTDPTHVFTWLICETRDDRGNAVLYEYKPEDGAGVDLGRAHERNRGDLNDPRRAANRYLKHVRYGNPVPLLDNAGQRPRSLTNAQIQDARWMFEVVFDYGEHNADSPQPSDQPTISNSVPWPVRNDPFSAYRAGFEIRTYRLCQRVLMFHHIPDLPTGEKGYEGLVRSTDFTYSYEENPGDARNPIFSFLMSVTQIGYKRQAASGYLKGSLPPVEFTYSEATIQTEIREVDPVSLENLPIGLAGSAYQWTDLYGEGIPGILTEQAGAWLYKRNLSPINVVGANSSTHVEARFASVELVATKPNLALAGHAQFLDLAGDGQHDLVTFRGPSPGFYGRAPVSGDWEPFIPFASLPVLDWEGPNLRFVDVTGDGLPDLLITEDDVFRWHPSLAEQGFGSQETTRQSRDEETGPRLVFADGTQSIYVADMSGDGLTDLVRIRNGEVCYWPNIGYGRFGAKVTMDNSPCFDAPDLFDQKRIRLADIDGSGAIDIIYLHGDGVRIYFNQSGNSWSHPPTAPAFPRIDSGTSVTVVDLLGNGTACLVWSSPMAGEARRPMRYIDLMGGQKPHLLIKTVNNLGAETSVSYAPSTKFYLEDKLAGKPWVTRLPFPVHCVEKAIITDKWRQTVFSSTYSYHHGYFDGIEREFRGFGRVEQLDAESYGKFAQGNSASPYITADQTLHQPPIKTVTWFHTGAFLDRERILSHFEHEYFPRWFEDMLPDRVNVLGGFQENILPQPNVEAKDASGAAEDLSPDEWREALRACKGMMLRQETYELDVTALEKGEQRPVKLFSTAYHNCHIQRLQALALNRHAVFLVKESEAITYHYELDLRPATVSPDPRIAHTLNLQFDEYANVLQSIAVVYPRVGKFEDDASLATGLNGSLSLIHLVQQERHLAYTETRYTTDVIPVVVNGQLTNPDTYRLRVPCEVLAYELTGISPKIANGFFTLAELCAFQLSPVHQTSGTAVPEISYYTLPKRTSPEKRLVENARMIFFKDDSPTLNAPLPFGQLGRLGLLYETYKLALTDDLLNVVFGAKLDAVARGRLSDATISGYFSGASLAARFGGRDTTGQYWIRSGIAGFAPDAAQHFYLPERYTDPFGNVTTLQYDPLDLFVTSSTDPLGSTTRVTRFDFRVLAPCEIQDINNNLSEVFFDVLGLPAGMAVKGKGNEGDNLVGFDDTLANPELAGLTAFFTNAAYDEAPARLWLGNATGRHVYYLGETRNLDGTITWGTHPSCSCGILRETLVSQLPLGEQSRLQTAFEYADGTGVVLVKKVQAEPEANGKPLRWVANGKTILNNKGKPVKQYEPYFSSSAHRFEEPSEEGVTPVIYYDAAGRTVRTEMPDGSYSRVEFSPWHVRTFDQNDTVKEPGNAWFAQKMAGTTEEKRAAQLAADHAETPALSVLDSLGREVIAIAHNRVKEAAGVLKDEQYLTFTKLDAEGKPLWIRDARKNLVMQYITPPVPDNQAGDPIAGFAPCYDIAGNLLFQHSMDAGERWMLNDAAGKPMLAWNSRGYAIHTEYDPLHRPVRSFVQGGDPSDTNSEFFASAKLFERIIYGEQHPEDTQRNLRGRAFKHLDQAGVVTNDRHDFKGNLLRGSRQLATDYKQAVDWKAVEVALPADPEVKLNIAVLNSTLTPLLENETFTSSSSYDALNRPIQLVAPHSDQPGRKFNVTRPSYNEANLLERVDVWLEETVEPASLLGLDTATYHVVSNIDYNAKAQRMRIDYGNGARTTYEYDPFTFRLGHLLTDRGVKFPSDWPQPPPRGGIQNLSYFYDPVGNITDIRDDAQQTIFFNGQKVEPSAAYEYDAIYRLTSATGREHIGQKASPQVDEDDSPRMNQPLPTEAAAMRNYAENYEYDPVGNILRMIHQAGATGSWTRRYDYEAASNRLRGTSLPGDGDGAFSAKYTYDLHGNMTRMPHLTVMAWDFKEQLRATQRQIVNSGGSAEKTYYVYDSAGQRVRKLTELASGQVKDERVYLGSLELYNTHGATPLVRETLHIMDDKQRVALVETRTQGNNPAPPQLIRYQFGNHLGSASLELNDRGTVISYEEYYPYGGASYQAVDQSVKAAAKRYRYTGKERDEESGLYYHGARYFAPWLGRWTTCDPTGINDSIDLFAFTRGNPICFIDRTGRNSEKAQHALESLKQVAKEVTHLLGEDFSARAKVVESQTKLDERVYRLSELKSDEIKRGLVNTANQERQIKQAEHNLKQAERNLTAAESHLTTTEAQLASANTRFAKAQKAAAKAGVSSNEVVGITTALEKEFASIVDAAEMNRPDWREAAKKGSGPKGGGSGGGTGGGAPPHTGSGGGTPPPAGNAPPSGSVEGSKSAVKEGQTAAKEEVAAVTAGEKAIVKGAEKSGLKASVRVLGKAAPYVGAGFAAYFVGKDLREERYGRAVVDATEGIPYIGDVVLGGELAVDAFRFGINLFGDISVSMNKQVRDAGK
jgi:RHS repeat-associated protein